MRHLPSGTCPQCSGAGYLRYDVPYGHPNFGKLQKCVCKEAEIKEKRRQQLLALSNMQALRSHTFETYNPRVPGVRDAYTAAQAFAQQPSGWLLFIGPNGCGKTHLAAAIANQRLDAGSLVLFDTVPDLLDHLRAAFAPDATSQYDDVFTRMREADLLILDDLGAQQTSPWASEKLFQLLNHRYVRTLPTVITANPIGIQAIETRVASRLSDQVLVQTIQMDRARDYRPQNTSK